MTRKKSNVKALALAVTCAILAGGGIGLEPVYAEDVTLNVSNGKITAGSVSGTITGTVGGVEITNGHITDGSLSSGIFTGTVTLTGSDIKTAIAGVDISQAKVGSETNSGTIEDLVKNVATNGAAINTLNTTTGTLKVNTQKITYDAATGTTVEGKFTVNGAGAGIYVEDNDGNHVQITSSDVIASNSVHATNTIASGINARMEGGKVVAQNGLYIGYTSDKITDASYDNSKFAVKGEDGSFKAANGAFGVDKDGKVATTGDIQGANITATGALKGKTLGIGTNGNEFTVDETGNTKVGGTLDVTGATILKDTLNVKGATTLGSTLDVTGKTTLEDELQVDKKATFGNATGLKTVIEGGNITAGGMLNSKSAKIGFVGIDNTGAITGVTSLTTDALTVTGAFTTGNLTVNGDLTASGAINGKTISITDGGSIAGVNFETGGKLTATTGTIGGVSFATGGVVSGVKEFTSAQISDGQGTIITNGNVESKTAKIGAIRIDNETIEGSSAHGLSIEGVKIKDGVMSSVVSIDATKATIGGVNTLNDTGLTVKTGSKVQVGTNTVIEDGSVKVSNKTILIDQSLQLNDTNKWTQEGGLVADKATVNGVVLGADGAAGKATFTDAASKTTTIDGDKIATGTITANELLIDKISLGKDGTPNISIDKDGDVTTKGEIKITDTAGNVMTKLAKDSATFGKDAANQTVIDKGTISANAEDNHQQAGLTFNENGLTVNGLNAQGKTSSFSFNAKTGDNTFTDKDGMTTTINGSSVRSFNSATGAGHLNGATLNLWKNNDNSTYMTAGGATFTKDGKTTTISGDTITTGTLNVTDIVLGGTMYDTAGKQLDGKLSIGNDGHLRAANGNFDVKDDGTFKNTVGNTTLQTGTTGASMKFDNTAAAGGVKSEVSVGANQVTMSAGNQTVTTTKDGTVFENSDHNTPFGGGSETKTTINGNEITTGKITTDQLVIKGNGSGDADGTGNGSIALGGDGSIKSNIKDTTTGIESTFETKADKIGSVITGGTVNLSQELDANTGKITNKAGDMSNELDNNGFTVKQNGKTDVKIADGDVTVTNNKNTATPDQEVHLSDLGSLNNLDGELAARDKYQDNKTAVGGINAEAAIRREEVARLDGRINDVNDRVNKVGAMAAAIASLKSIGYDPQAPSEFSIGLGQYKGETGVAMGFFHYPNKNFMINVSLSTAGGETMGGIGATWRFGHKSPQKLLEEQREAQAKKELAAAEKYQAAAKLAKEAQERAEYAAKLARQAQVSADNAKAAADATQAKHFG